MHRTIVIISLLALALSVAFAATITGKVVGPDGKPIAGAHVYVRLLNEDKPLELLTGTAGNYSGETDHALLRDNYANRAYVWAPGYTLAQVSVEASGNVITLEAGVSISGTVTDTAGKALAGVPVRVVCVRDEQ